MKNKVSYIGFKALHMGFDAHLTVLYVGDMNHESLKACAIKDCLDDIPTKTGWVSRWKIDMFGPEQNIPVLRVDVSEQMFNLRNILEREFGSASQFKDWNPHITLDFDHLNTIHIPSVIRLIELDLY